MKVGVVGLGNLGIANLALLSSFGHDVLAYDSNSFLVSSINRKARVIRNKKIRGILEENFDKISFANELNELESCQIIIVTIELEVNNFNYSLNPFYDMIDRIKNLKGKHTLLIKTPMPVGTCQKINEYMSDARGEFYVAYEPAVSIDDSMWDEVFNLKSIVIGTISKEAHFAIIELYEKFLLDGVDFRFITFEEAELYRVAISSLFVANMRFVTSMHCLYNEFGLNFNDLLDLLNIIKNNLPLRVCLGNSNKAIYEKHNTEFFLNRKYESLLTLKDSNELLAKQFVNRLPDNEMYGIYGISDKYGDLNYFILAFIKELLLRGKKIIVYDYQSEGKLKKILPNKKILYAVDPKSLVKKTNTIVLLTKEQDFEVFNEEFCLKYGASDLNVYDFAGVYKDVDWHSKKLHKMYDMINVFYKEKASL